LRTPINPVFRLGLPRFLFFEIGASAIFRDRCSEALLLSTNFCRKLLQLNRPSNAIVLWSIDPNPTGELYIN
jgi:hypothetical protein